MNRKNLRRISMVVTAQTAANLEKLAQMDSQSSIGRVMDKLVREKMISLRQPKEVWMTHYINRFKEVR